MPILMNLPQWFLELENGDMYIKLMTNKGIRELENFSKDSDKNYLVIKPGNVRSLDHKPDNFYEYLLIYDIAADLLIHKLEYL